jgi:putative oxidoreductase
MPLTLLVLRLTVGLLLAGHGGQKLFGWSGGSGLRPTASWLATMGFRPPFAWAVLAGGLEFGGGFLFALGLFSPLGSLMIAASMLTAIAKVHWPKLWATTGGFELPLVNLAVVIAVGLAGGPGALSLDNIYQTALPPGAFLVGGLVVIMGWLFALFTSTLTAVSDPAAEQKSVTAYPAPPKNGSTEREGDTHSTPGSDKNWQQ